MSRVLVVHWGRTAAGPALSLKLAQELLADGRHDVAVSYSAQSDLVSEFRALTCPRFEVATWSSARGVPKAFMSLPGVVRGLRRFMRDNGVTTTIVPMEQPMQSPVAWAFGSGGSRYVHFMHDASLHPGEQSVVVAALRRLHLFPAQEVVVFSDSVREAAIQGWSLDADRLHQLNLPPMFESPADQRDRELPQDRAVVCGMFGRAIQYKGFDLAVEAVAELRAQGRDVTLRLVGAGVTAFIPEKYLGASWLQVEDRWLADGEITEVMGSFDVLLLPYREASQSGVLVESAALGVPAVVTPVGGLPEQVAMWSCGLVADSVSASAVAAAIAQLVDEPLAYARVSRGARSRAYGPAAWRTFLAQLEPLLA